MSFDMVRTGLDWFPVQYGEHFVYELNRAYGSKSILNKLTLEKIGMAVFPRVLCTGDAITDDGYSWFVRLDCASDEGLVTIFSPYKNASNTKMDRSINVYSDKRLSDEFVSNTLEDMARRLRAAPLVGIK